MESVLIRLCLVVRCSVPQPLLVSLLSVLSLNRCKRKGITGKMEVLREIVRVIRPRKGVVYGAVRALAETAILSVSSSCTGQ